MNESEVVVVTGASAGVGRATVRAFARRGSAVALLARGEDGLAAAAAELEAAGVRSVSCPVDVADADAVEAAAGRVEEELGPIDVWVNNAMATVFAPFTDIEPAEYRRVTEVTYLGFVHGTMSALQRMIPRDRGTIVQVGSALAYQGIPLQSAYCGAKHAIRGFTDSVRAELRHDGSNVHLTQIHLPGMNTPQFRWGRTHLPRRAQPVPPILQPEAAADAIVWAVERGSRDVLLDGPTVQTVLGAQLAPWLMRRIVARKAYEGQMTDELVPPDREDNLFTPMPGDAGAHGVFDDRAGIGPLRGWLGSRRPLDAAASAVAGALGFAVRLVDKR